MANGVSRQNAWSRANLPRNVKTHRSVTPALSDGAQGSALTAQCAATPVTGAQLMATLSEPMVSLSLVLPPPRSIIVVRASARGAGGRGFDPRPRHTKDVKKLGGLRFSAWRLALMS